VCLIDEAYGFTIFWPCTVAFLLGQSVVGWRRFAANLTGLKQVHLLCGFPEFAAEIRVGNADQCLGSLFG
jgi:hypothetical protein